MTIEEAAPKRSRPVVAHADWGSEPAKRQFALALPQDNRYILQPPEEVGELATFFDVLLNHAGANGTVAAGFDFPIGLPQAYAELAGIHNFLAVLPQFGVGDWADFYTIAKTRDEIGVHRPFYPYRPGGARRQYLLGGLGLGGVGQLRRQCELRTQDRRAACPLFWTLGGNQVGRSAIIGWRDLLSPAIGKHGAALAIWPFVGNFQELIATRRLIVAETYPAEVYTHLGFPANGWSKRTQVGRLACGNQMQAWIDGHAAEVQCSPALLAEIQDGFGADADGEDLFDATVGLLGMLEVVLGYRADGAPAEALVRQVEGWILGQQQ